MSNTSVLPEKSSIPDQHVAILAASAGMQLSEAHLAELVDAYGYIQRMLARIHGRFDRADEPAHVFVASTFASTRGVRA
jgi:hypothetical protein